MQIREGLRRIGWSLAAVYWAIALLISVSDAYGQRQATQAFRIEIGGRTFDVQAYDHTSAYVLALAYSKEHPAGPWDEYTSSIYVPGVELQRAPLESRVKTGLRNVAVAALIFAPFYGIAWLFGWIVRGFAGD